MSLAPLFVLLSCLVLGFEGASFDTGKCSFELNAGKTSPKYDFWKNETQKYLIQFKSLIEYDLDDKPIDGGFSLEFLNWVSTSPSYDTEEELWNLNFTANSTKRFPFAIMPMKQILIENRVLNGTSRTKLNIHIYNYTFSNPNNSVALTFTLTNPTDSFVGFVRRSYIQNNSSYLYITETATVDSSTGKKLTIVPQLRIEGDRIVVEYPHFTGNLHHEMDLGLGYPPSVLPWWLFSLILGVTVLALVVGVTLAVYIFLRRRRIKYQLIDS